MVVQTDTGCSHPFSRNTGDSVRFRQALYCYGSSWQPMFTKMQQDMGVTFHPGIPTIPWEEVFPSEQRPSLLVLDDLMIETVDSDQVMDLLSKKVHHLNLFVIVVTQNLYALGKHSVGMNRNYQYTILFRNPAEHVTLKHRGNVGWVMRNVLCLCTNEPLLRPMGI